MYGLICAQPRFSAVLLTIKHGNAEGVLGTEKRGKGRAAGSESHLDREAKKEGRENFQLQFQLMGAGARRKV